MILPVLEQNVFSGRNLNEQFICCRFHIVAEDQSDAAFNIHIEGKMHFWCGFVSFCYVFAGGTQALICIDTPLLLIILDLIYLFI